MTARTPRLSQPKLWTGIALAGAALGLAATPLSAGTLTGFATGGPERLWLATSEGGEGGEGGAAVTNDGEVMPMVAQLGLLEGALRAGAELAKAGEKGSASGHVHDLVKDNYDPIEADLDKYKAPAFETELVAAITAIEAAASADDITAATDKALAGIATARAADMEPKEWFEAVIFLTRKAGEEYGKGVAGGKLADAGEYEESWGNLQAARSLAVELAASTDAKVKSAGAAAVTALDEVGAAYSGILGDGALSGDESLFAAAAARIELAAFKVK